MAQSIKLPDGSFFPLKEGEDPREAMAEAARKYPEAFGRKKEEDKPKQDTSGFKAAASAGATRLGGEFELLKGKLGVKSEAEAQKEYEAAQKRAQERFTPTEKGFTEEPLLKFRELLGGSVPYMVAPAAAGLAALAAPVSAPVAAGLGLLGAGAVSTGQFTGSNLARQMDTGKSLEETSLGKAAAAAVPQALIDTAAMALLPGVGKLFGSVGSKLTTEQAKAIASQTLTRTIADYTAKTGVVMGREGVTEATQQLLERLQAGLEITDPEARKEYIDSFIGGAVLGGVLAPAGRAYERGGAKRQAAAADRAEALQLSSEQLQQQKAQEEAAAQALEAEKQTPEYAIKFTKDYQDLLQQYQDKRKVLKDPGKNATPEEKAVYKEAQAEVSALYAQLGELTPEYRELKDKARIAQLTPQEYMLEQTGEVSSAPTPKGTPDLAGYYEQQIAVPGQALTDYAKKQITLANTQGLANEKDPADAAQDYVQYLLADPVLAKQVLQKRIPLPGLTKKQQNLIYGGLELQIADIDAKDKAAGEAGTAATRARLSTVEQEEAAALEDQRQMRQAYEMQQEGRNATDIERIQPLTGTTSQGDLFGGEQQRVNMPVAGTRVDIDAQIVDLQKQLDVARSYGAPTAIDRRSNRERVSTLLEQIRDLKDRKAKMEGGGATAFGTESKDSQEQLGSLPKQERAQREAATARDTAYDRFKNGEVDAKQDVVDSLVKEISLVRGRLKPETITEIEKELGALLDSSIRYGNDITPQLDAVSTRWRAGVKYGTFGPAETIPTTTTQDMLLDQMDRAYAQRQRYDTQTMSILDQIAQNYGAVTANEDRRNLIGEWLNRATTGNLSPEMTRDVQSALRTLEEGKRSETETPTRETAFGTATKPTQTAVQQELGAEFMPEQVAPQAATRIVNGKVQYVAPEDRGPIQGSAAERYAPTQKGTIFESFAELNRYLASDYLKAARQEMGITRETVARMELQVKEHEAKIANIRKQVEALKARKAALEKSQISEDRAAKNIVVDVEVRMEGILKRLSDELEPLRLEYMRVRSQVDQLADRSEETSRLIANNIANFKEMDDRAVDAAQETLKAKEELRQARNKLGSLAEKLPGIELAQQKVITALERQRNPLLYESRQQLQDLQKQLSKARVTQPRTVARLQKEIAELELLIDTQRVNPYIPSSAFITFLNNDLRLQLDAREERRKLNKAGKTLLDLGLQLELAAVDLDVNLSTHPEIVAIKQEIGAAKELGADAVRALDNDLALLDSEIEKAENASYVESQLAKSVEQAIKDTAESRGFGAQMADVPIEPLSSAERDAVTARDKAQLETFQASTARLQAISGQRIDFTKRREMLELVKTATTDFAKLDATLKELDDGVTEMQVRVELVQIKLDEATEKAASYRGPRKNLKEAKALFAQIEDFKKQIEAGNKRVETLQKSIADYEKSRVTKQKALSEAERATSSDPEVYAEVTKLIDDRIAKLEKTISKKQEAVNKSEEAIAKLSRDIKAKKLAWAEGTVTPETLKNLKERLANLRSSQKERRKRFNEFLKEREVLQARKSNRLGITRTDVLTGKKVEGERTKKAPAQIQEQIDAENERAAMYDYRFSGLQDLEKQMAGLSATPEPKTAKAKANRAERIRALQEKINQQIDLVNEVLPPKQEKISQAARVQSRAPSKLRGGTEQSKANVGISKQPIVESRTPAPITSEKAVADANAFAERIAAAKDKETLDAEFKAKEFEQQNQILDAMEDNRVRLTKFINRSQDELSEIGEVLSGNPTLADRRDKLKEDIESAQFMLDRVGDDINRLLKEQIVPYTSEDFTQLSGTDFSSVTDEDIDTTDDPRYTFRTVTRGPTSLQTAQVERLAERITKGWVNAPEIVVVATEADLPVRIRGQIVKADRAEGTTPGLFDTKTKKVYLIASNLSNANDVILTLAHEAAGHYGLRELLGDKYTSTMNSLYRGNPEVRKQADAKLKADKSLSREVAVEEVLAEMAEDPNPTPAEKSALRQIYERLRAWLRSVIGLPNITDAEVQQLVANARRYVIEGGVAGAGQAPSGEATYRTKAAAEPDNALIALSRQITAQPKTLKEKLSNNLALQAEMQAVDMRAGLRDTLKFGDDNLFTQAMYHVRKAEQKMAQMFTVMNSGPLVTYRDAKGFVGYRSSNENSARDVFDAIADVPVADPQLKTNITQAYMVAQRTANKGLPKLDLGELGITEEQLTAALAAADADPALKKALENVRTKYNAYNRGMIEFLASTGRISKKVAADLLKEGDYVPFYRVDKNGNASLVFNNNVTFNVGDIRRQPYLAELKGGDTKLLPLNEAIQRNTLLLTDMALTNNAAKSVAYGMQALGKGKGPVDPKTGKPTDLMAIKIGRGPDDAKVIRFYQEPDPNKPNDKGERYIEVDTKGTAAEGIPAELVVQSLEGASLALPGFFKLGGAAADLLRAGVTRTPLYIARKLLREPMAASFTGGLDSNVFSSVFKAGAEFVRMSTGNSAMQAKLIEKGLIQSNIFAGDMSDMKKMALQLASGKDQGALDKVLAAADRYAMRADAATLALVLKNAEANGLSEVEADMATMESMNFYKRGLSPTLQYASRLIPFFNAQIQGLNVLYKAARGQMPFEEQQQIKRKFFNNAMLLMGTGIVYAMAMDDDETFRNARPRDKYANFFLPIPGVDEPLKLPIPFEAGYFFSLAVAAVDGMRAETDGKAQFQALKDMFLNSVPGYSSMGIPALVKPVFEVWTDKNFLTGGPIEPRRMQGYNTEERYLATTTELAKQMSKLLPILSPIQIEHIVRGYLGVLPLAAAAGANGLFEREGRGEKPEGRASDLPLIGTAFQKKYGGGDADVVYREAQEAVEANATFKKMLSEGRREEAVAYRDKNRVEMAMAPAAGQYRQIIGRINTDIRRVQERDDLTAEEKRLRLDALEKAKQDRADAFIRQSRAVEERLGGG
jgi:phage shock protein A